MFVEKELYNAYIWDNITDIKLNFDSDAEIVAKWFNIWDTAGWGVTTSWGNLIVNASSNDSWWSVYYNVSWLDKWTFQARVYVQSSDWWWSNHVSVWGGAFSTITTNNNPWHHFNLTTSSWYTWQSWIGTGSSYGNQYSNSWWFTWRYVYEIVYNNWTYTMTRYNDTSEVTPESTYTNRASYSWLWASQLVWVYLRTWYTYQNYNKADWFRIIY